MKKYNIFVINPISIVGDIIIKGIARGFEKLGHNIISFDVRKIDEKKVNEFKPDLVLGLGYAHFFNEQAEKYVKNLNIPVIHYFIDDPHSDFAHAGNEKLYDKLCKTDGIIFSWDSHYLNSFHKKAYYLPVGIDTELYQFNNNIKYAPRAKIVFTGRPLTDKREKVIAHIIKNFPDFLHIYSYKAHFDKSVEEMKTKGFLNDLELENYKKCYKGFLENERELASVYHNSDIILNITMDQGATSMNYRVLEVLASGAFLLTDYVGDTATYFEEDKEFVFYRNLSELTEKINKFINNSNLRTQIAGNGKKKVELNHTLNHRAKEIIDTITINQLL